MTALCAVAILLSSLSIFPSAVSGEESPNPAAGNITGTIFDPDTVEEGPNTHFVVEYAGPIEEMWRKNLEETGLDIISYLHPNCYLVEGSAKNAARLTVTDGVERVRPFTPAEKLSRRCSGTQNELFSVMFFPNIHGLKGPDDMEGLMGERGFSVVGWSRENLDGLVRGPASKIADLAALDGIRYIEPYLTPKPTNNIVSDVLKVRKSATGPHNSDPSSMWSWTGSGFDGLTGAGINVAVVDTGVYGAHSTFSGRTVKSFDYIDIGEWKDLEGHGTHTAGTVLGSGAGSQSNKYAGMAPEAGLVSQAIIDGKPKYTDWNQIVKDGLDNGARISSNSWGSDNPGDDYGFWDYYFDRLTLAVNDRSPGQLFVFSAGNEGHTIPTTNTITSPCYAKNIITVGSTNHLGTSIAGHSSTGPTNDGRIKPDLVTPGENVMSARTGTSSQYVPMTGTSMSCPSVTGCAALVSQYFATKLNSPDPTPAMIKATLINGAVPMHTSFGYPNGLAGWGRVDMEDTLGGTTTRFFDDAQHQMVSGLIQEYTVVINGNDDLRITLAYSDPAAQPGREKDLINNLDLEIESPGGTVYLGNVFQDTKSATGGSADDTNNVEMVWLDSPASGEWTIRVKGTNVPEGPQDYALALSGDVADAFAHSRQVSVVGQPVFSDDEPVEGDSVSVSAVISNDGNQVLKDLPYRFTLNQLGKGDDLEFPGTIPTISPGESKTVSHQWTCVSGNFQWVIRVEPPGTYADDELDNANLSPIHVLSCSFGMYFPINDPPDPADVFLRHVFDPDTNEDFPISIENTGEADDTYELVVETSSPDWDAEPVSNPSVEVKAGETEVFSISVTTPSDGLFGTGSWIFINATGQRSVQPPTQAVSMECTMGLYQEILLEAPYGVSGVPQGVVEIPITVTNLGNALNRTHITITDSTDQYDPWPVSLDENAIDLAPQGGMATVNAMVSVPENARADSVRDFTIDAVMDQVRSQTTVSVTVDQVFDMTVLNAEGDRGDSGDQVTATLTVENRGNGEDMITVELADQPDGWSLTASDPSHVLDAFDIVDLELGIAIPEDAEAGYLTLEILVRSELSGWEETVDVPLEVKERKGASLSGTGALSTTPDSPGSLDITILNTGNTPCTYSVDVVNFPSGWELSISDTSVMIQNDEEEVVNLQITPDPDAQEGDYSFRVQVSSDDSWVLENLPVTVTVNEDNGPSDDENVEDSADDEKDDEPGGHGGEDPDDHGKNEASGREETVPMAVLGLLLVLAVVGIISILFMARRKKSKTSPAMTVIRKAPASEGVSPGATAPPPGYIRQTIPRSHPARSAGPISPSGRPSTDGKAVYQASGDKITWDNGEVYEYGPGNQLK